jgi:NAD(P)-dependent dehydrogenase (short-subunit alcohol dehydrogenase family)
LGGLFGGVLKVMEKSEIQTILITGASSGVGRACAVDFATEGHYIFCVARRKEKLDSLEKELSGKGKLSYAVGDVSDPVFVQSAVKQCVNNFGKINSIVVAAGNTFIRPFNKTTIDDFHELMNVNTFGVVNICKEAIKHMEHCGSVVLFPSPAGIYGAKGMTAYALSKGGIIAFGKSLALELAPKKIRINMISLGYVKTEMTDKIYGYLTPDQKKKIESEYALGIGKVEDVVNAVKFLTSDQSSWVTGVVLSVDGGLTSGI